MKLFSTTMAEGAKLRLPVGTEGASHILQTCEAKALAESTGPKIPGQNESFSRTNSGNSGNCARISVV
jgi:hypothetical protein